jgi:hypothetical protein
MNKKRLLMLVAVQAILIVFQLNNFSRYQIKPAKRVNEKCAHTSQPLFVP